MEASGRRVAKTQHEFDPASDFANRSDMGADRSAPTMRVAYPHSANASSLAKRKEQQWQVVDAQTELPVVATDYCT
eukprot:4895502-Amphidinium_carterae.1